jgi:hypothetical protein
LSWRVEDSGLTVYLEFGSSRLPESQHLDEELECGGVDDEREDHEAGDKGETPSIKKMGKFRFV